MSYRLATDLKMRPLRPFKHKNGVYYIRIRLAGQDIWRSLKTKKRKEAEELAYQHWYYLQQNLVQNIFQKPQIPAEYAAAGAAEYKYQGIPIAEKVYQKMWGVF